MATRLYAVLLIGSSNLHITKKPSILAIFDGGNSKFSQSTPKENPTEVFKVIKKVLKTTAIRELSLHFPLAPKNKIEEEADVLVSLWSAYLNDISKMDGGENHLQDVFSISDPIHREKELGPDMLYNFWRYLEHLVLLLQTFPRVELYTGTAFV